jgi:hypothetical protein
MRVTFLIEHKYKNSLNNSFNNKCNDVIDPNLPNYFRWWRRALDQVPILQRLLNNCDN